MQDDNFMSDSYWGFAWKGQGFPQGQINVSQAYPCVVENSKINKYVNKWCVTLFSECGIESFDFKNVEFCIIKRSSSLNEMQWLLCAPFSLSAKVKFQHEVYPPCQPGRGASLSECPVSRQAFIVQDLEIRDRLATSQMNKFLYLYCSKEMPRKAHSNMVRCKSFLLCDI